MPDTGSAIRMAVNAMLLLTEHSWGVCAPKATARKQLTKPNRGCRLSEWCRERRCVSRKVFGIVHSRPHTHSHALPSGFRRHLSLGWGWAAWQRSGHGTGTSQIVVFQGMKGQAQGYPLFILPGRGHGQPLRTVAIIS